MCAGETWPPARAFDLARVIRQMYASMAPGIVSETRQGRTARFPLRLPREGGYDVYQITVTRTHWER